MTSWEKVVRIIVWVGIILICAVVLLNPNHL